MENCPVCDKPWSDHRGTIALCDRVNLLERHLREVLRVTQGKKVDRREVFRIVGAAKKAIGADYIGDAEESARHEMAAKPI